MAQAHMRLIYVLQLIIVVGKDCGSVTSAVKAFKVAGK